MAQTELWIEGEAKLVVYDECETNEGKSVEVLIIGGKPKHSINIDTLMEATVALKKKLVVQSINALAS